METVTIYAESIDDVSVNGPDALEVTLLNVDINNLITEVGQENILDEISLEELEEYLETRRESEKAEEESE